MSPRKAKKSKGIRVLIVFVAIAIVAFIAINFLQQNPAMREVAKIGGGDKADVLPYDKAVSKLSRLVGQVDWSEDLIDWREKIRPGQGADLKENLPDISEFKLVVAPAVGAREVAVELFVSSEKSGKDTDGWMVEVAQAFNKQNKLTSDGRPARIKIRKIASGVGYQFIAARKHLPQGYSPSNHLWVRMAAAHGVRMTPVRERMVGNIAGVVMKTSTADSLRSDYGTLDMKNLVDAVVQGRLVMGYTNPFASSTGLNFLVTVLATFSGNDAGGLLSPAVVSAFEGFQRGVPFVAMTTLQIRDSVEKGGSLDAFVMEYQTFVKTPTLQSGYEFIPFGILHDNPLYGVGDLRPEEAEVLELFAAFAEQAKFQNLANKYGFNPSLTHDPLFQIPPGDILIQAQQTWKEKKDSGRPIAAIFLADTSGSMGGTRINRLKQALKAGSEFISTDNSIGLVLFSSEVRVVLNIKKFNLIQKSEFHAAVSEIEAGGGTAMYDGIAVALSLLLAEKERNPEIRPMLFVLTDGKTTAGIEFAELSPTIGGLRIPIYTIGFEADIKELARLSGLVEAASLNAASGDIRYKIGSLLNAEM